MNHIVTTPPDPIEVMGGAALVHCIPAASSNLVWVLECCATRQAAIIDGPDAFGARQLVSSRGLDLVAILNTHVHNDHIGVNLDLQKSRELQSLRVFGCSDTRDDVPGMTDAVDDGDIIGFGALKGAVLRVDGHLNGHIAFLFGDALFCGDTLFTGGCGRIFDGPTEVMFASLMRLAALPPATKVFCAHDYTVSNLEFAFSVEPGNQALVTRLAVAKETLAAGECSVPSTIGLERATNPFLRPGSPEIVGAIQRQLAGPPTHASVFAATRALKDRF